MLILGLHTILLANLLLFFDIYKKNQKNRLIERFFLLKTRLIFYLGLPHGPFSSHSRVILESFSSHSREITQRSY